MTTLSTDTIPAVAYELEFGVPAATLYASWTEAARLRHWFAADGYQVTDIAVDAAVDGAWSMTFAGPNGHTYVERGRYLALEPPTRVEMTLQQIDGDYTGPETQVSVDFLDLGSRSRMVFRQTGFTDAGQRQGNAEGWGECFRKLGEMADSASGADSAEAEIRALHDAWFAASERKDLDASMAPIAADVVSYEHVTPQEYRGVEAIRPICEAGFQYQANGFRWDVPDLEVIVRGDIAVTWGLNRMASHMPDGTMREEWSRGTRIFLRIDGAWKMIHQHVSFPMDPETGSVSMSR